MTFAFTWITSDFATAGQIGVDDLPQAASAGFRSVVNNRPDFEGGPGQPTSQAIEAAAAAAGLGYAFVPVRSGFVGREDVARMHEVLKTLPKPVLAYCRSGTRSGVLFRAAQAMEREQ